MESLAKFATVLIVRVSIPGLPGVNKTAQDETSDLVKAKGTTKRHARVTKTLFADSTRAIRLRQIAAAVRNWLRTASLPGEVDGKYMIPAAQFERIGGMLNEFQSQYNATVAEFAANLDSEIEADRQKKNNFFDRDDYPDEDQVREVQFSWGFEPLPDSSAFTRIFDGQAIADEIAAEFAEKHENHLHDLFDKADQVNRERLESRIRKSLVILRRYKGEKGQKLQYTNLVELLIEEAKTARDLNVAKSAEVERLATGVLDLFAAFEPERLKDAQDRADVIKRLSTLMGETEVAEVPAEPVAEPVVPVAANGATRRESKPARVPDLATIDF